MNAIRTARCATKRCLSWYAGLASGRLLAPIFFAALSLIRRFADAAIEKYSHGLRGTLNVIHPAKHIQERSELDTHVAQIAQLTVRSVVEGLAGDSRSPVPLGTR